MTILQRPLARYSRWLFAAFAWFLLAGCGGGGSTSTPTPAPPAPTPPTMVTPPIAGTPAADQLAQDLQGKSLGEFFDLSFKAIMLRYPETVIGLALDELYELNNTNLDNLSDAYQRDTFAMHQVSMDALLNYNRETLSDADKINYDVYQWYLQDVIDQLEFIYYDFKSTYLIFGVHSNTQRFFTDIHPIENEQDARDYIARLGNVRTKLGQLEDHFELQRDVAGVIEPSATLSISRNRIEGVANATAEFHPYYVTFRNKVNALTDIDEAVRTQLLNEGLATVNSGVIPAYRSLLSTMDGLVARASGAIGVGQFEKGEQYYSYILKHHTTTNLTAQEIHQLGLSELQRISNDMRILFDRLGYPQNEALQDLFDRVSNDGGIVSSNDALATFESLVEFASQNLEDAFDLRPEADVIIIPDSTGGGFYIGPSLDNSRPGAFYAGTNAQPYYNMPSLTYHETLPGHHFQIALAQEQDVPVFRKILNFTGFVEGWGLYAERLAYELGWYEGDDFGNLGRLQFEALRAARLVMDTGIHDLGWSFNQASVYNVQNVGWSARASEGAALRYSAIPGQATSYMVGMLKILEVRQRAMDSLGTTFDLKEFHNVVLRNGAVPLALLDDIVDGYIADTLAGQ